MSMITVFGADWCDDTRRSLRHLRRLGVPHLYRNVDEDLDALHRAAALNGGVRRTPTIDLGFGGAPLIEPDNDTLTGALIEKEMLSAEEVTDRLGVQNVGDVERIARTTAGLALMAAASAGRLPGPLRWAGRLAGLGVALTGVSGWCPVFHTRRVTSLGGPGDRPDEASRDTWLTPLPAEPPLDLPEPAHD
jgi:glutaredoxin